MTLRMNGGIWGPPAPSVERGGDSEFEPERLLSRFAVPGHLLCTVEVG